MIDEVISNDKCTGCKMCGDLCPKKVISFEINDEGFWYPKVNKEGCINCKLCVDKCPALSNENLEKESPKVYSAWIKDSEIRLKSTSGGLYYALADAVLKKGGYLAGSVYESDYKSAKHVIGNSKEDLEQIMGSKYFQSDTSGIYISIKKLLEDNKLVLFCGTPCQAAALQSFLKKNYENLIIIDFICRGINSPLAFRRHIEELEEEYNSPVEYVKLKNKKTGWQSLATYIKFKNGEECHQDKDKSLWVKGFVGGGGLYIREACHSCQYRNIPRVSDITLGDFWGIQGMSEDNKFKGISSVLINSKKGESLFKDISSNVVFEERNFSELLSGNPALLHQVEKNMNRNNFFKMLKTHRFSESVSANIEPSLKSGSIVTKVLRKGKRVLGKVKFLLSISTIKFVKYNFLSKNIVREKGSYLIPHKNAILDLSKDSRIYVKGKNLEIGINKLKGSKAETHIRMNGNAKWYSNNGCDLFYNTVLEIKNNAVFESGYFSANGGSVIICAKHIKFGQDVMLGRNIVIYDSDHHQVLDEHYKMINNPKEVILEDHVWLTSNVTVLKGVRIEKNSLITAQTLIRKDCSENSLVSGGSSGKVVGKINGWDRRSTQ
ncbi:Coenzyme F420 hydrogenase/dehydrogenase, beta subunit C-terminal domain [Clostridium beijerinckii]|uniref:Coenzyme F420 hydrogenase/dehydrogenase, beta subunit C-terminal domain n=1 Tax=Clostridium beijerinckii TaxID=1520 RepID=UPI0003D38A5F|nr:Coenzyme F420 hydrogenase/dehydrogenase, beta subunit C-terminal domain [Clostridium beijerinckii]ALB47600.1 4Fe-4S dicluster domain-containing protein [Clostridium beijerinckii NRRL B-598]